MQTRTREEHLQWCKDRAMRYVHLGDYNIAITSMLSDLKKHKETKFLAIGPMASLALLELMNGTDRNRATKFIQGFL